MMSKEPWRDINFFFKTIEINGHKSKVFDFEKFKLTPHNMFIIISARGLTGKTYNAKEFAYNEYVKHGAKSIWLRNLPKHIDKEKVEFLKIDECPPDMYLNSYIDGSAKKNTLGVFHNNTKEMYIAFQAMNSAEQEKGTRRYFDYFFWDEFNVDDNKVLQMSGKWASLLGSTENIVKNYGQEEQSRWFIFGNSKTLNNAFIRSYGIRSIKEEVTSIDISGYPTILVLVPTMNEKQQANFEKDMIKNARYRILKASGQADHNYFNKSLYDDINYVEEVVEKLRNAGVTPKEMSKYITRDFVVFHKGRYYAVLRINMEEVVTRLGCEFHVMELPERPKGETIYTLNQSDVIEGAYRAVTGTKTRLQNRMGQSGISFEDIGSRELFISSIR